MKNLTNLLNVLLIWSCILEESSSTVKYNDTANAKLLLAEDEGASEVAFGDVEFTYAQVNTIPESELNEMVLKKFEIYYVPLEKGWIFYT